MPAALPKVSPDDRRRRSLRALDILPNSTGQARLLLPSSAGPTEEAPRMPLDPDAETLLAMMRAAGRPPMETLTPDEARQAFAAGRAVTQPDPQDVAEVRDFSCPGPH